MNASILERQPWTWRQGFHSGHPDFTSLCRRGNTRADADGDAAKLVAHRFALFHVQAAMLMIWLVLLAWAGVLEAG